MRHKHDIQSILFSSNGANLYDLVTGAIDETLRTINGAVGMNVTQVNDLVRQVQPTGPLFITEGIFI